jgi:KOW motif
MPRIPTPLRLTLEDFDAFLPAGFPGGAKPRTSRATPATRARLDLAARMVRWARSVVRRLEDQGLDVRVVAPGFGAGPRKGKGAEAQRVLIQENEAALRDPTGVEARWALNLDGNGVDVALEIPAASSSLVTLRAALAEDEQRPLLFGLLEALPEQFTVGIVGETGVSPHEVGAWGGVLERSASTGRSVRLGWNVPKDVAIAHSSLLDEQLEDAIVLLAPFYQFVAHGGENDRAGSEGRRGRGRGRLGTKLRPTARSAARPAGTELQGLRTVERGARVRVLAGPFAGKVGIVKEVDGKGRAQVMLGLLATRIDLVDLSASSGGRRPTLSSSHRKPLALR